MWSEIWLYLGGMVAGWAKITLHTGGSGLIVVLDSIAGTSGHSLRQLFMSLIIYKMQVVLTDSGWTSLNYLSKINNLKQKMINNPKDSIKEINLQHRDTNFPVCTMWTGNLLSHSLPWNRFVDDKPCWIVYGLTIIFETYFNNNFKHSSNFLCKNIPNDLPRVIARYARAKAFWQLWKETHWRLTRDSLIQIKYNLNFKISLNWTALLDFSLFSKSIQKLPRSRDFSITERRPKCYQMVKVTLNKTTMWK